MAMSSRASNSIVSTRIQVASVASQKNKNTTINKDPQVTVVTAFCVLSHGKVKNITSTVEHCILYANP